MTLIEAAAIPHKGAPEGYNWYTFKRGSWRDKCKHCDRIVLLCFRERKDGTMVEFWRHLS